MGGVRILHYVNQFFAGLGGEARADLPPKLVAGPTGTARALAQCLAPQATVVGTLICGDDAFNTDPERCLAVLADLAAPCAADVLVAGPAFDAGRYGVACAQVCETLGSRLGIPAVTAMAPENPGRAVHGRNIFVLPTTATATGMPAALEGLAAFALKLARREPIGPANEEGYLPRGRRLNVLDPHTGAERAVEALVRQLHGEVVEGEIPLPAATTSHPAPALSEPATARIALVTTGGIVPRGNPDGIESRHATRWLTYSIASLDRVEAGRYECVHSGFDTTSVTADPHRVLPLDAGRDLEREHRIGRLHDRYYVTTGVSTTIENGRRFGRQIAEDLIREGVTGVIMTAT
jgi:betaine reductase